MKKLRTNLLLTFTVFAAPLLITAVFKFVGIPIGPVVFLYSIATGIFLGAIWGRTAKDRWNAPVGILIGLLVSCLGFILVINAFIVITVIFGKMDYDLF